MKTKFRIVIFGFAIELGVQKQTSGGHNKWPSDNWKATHRHRKGGTYRRLCSARLEADESPVIVYDDKIGNTWVRSQTEFEDGRFAVIKSEP